MYMGLRSEKVNLVDGRTDSGNLKCFTIFLSVASVFFHTRNTKKMESKEDNKRKI